MHDDAGIVEHDPGSLLVAGGAQRHDALRLARFDDRIGDGPHLAVGVALADHEVVRDRAFLPQVDPNDAPSLLVRSGIRDEPAELKWGHRPNYPSLAGTRRQPR